MSLEEKCSVKFSLFDGFIFKTHPVFLADFQVVGGGRKENDDQLLSLEMLTLAMLIDYVFATYYLKLHLV